MKPKIGFLVGKFAPLHLGHVHLINNAASCVDHLYVILSYDEKFLLGQPEHLRKILSRNNRFRWLKKTFQDLDHITCLCVDESNLSPYPNGWPKFVELINSALGVDQDPSIPSRISHIFGSEPQDAEQYEYYFPNAKYQVIDANREHINISATRIRHDVYQHWSYLPSIVRADFAVRVAVVGPESTGKTTLVKYLAKAYGTSWVEEYGRKFVEDELCGDETLLEPHHYPWIAMHHKIQEQEALRTCNKIMFSDTDASITEVFMRLYEDDYPDREEYQRNFQLVHQIAKWEQYDLVLILTPSVPWVDDGMRRLGQDDSRRNALAMIDTIERQNNLKPGINASPSVAFVGKDTYHERLHEAMAHVDELFKSKAQR